MAKFNVDKLLIQAQLVDKESKAIDFKSEFDPNLDHDVCEIIKDIAAIANSGGGAIIIGANDDGSYANNDITPILKIDPAKITDKMEKYTGIQFSDFEIMKIKRKKKTVAAMVIYPISTPLVFIKPGTYSIAHGKQKTAFSKGTVYFRHGAKSEPGNHNDLRKVIEREIEENRKGLFKNIRKVIYSPGRYNVSMLPPEVKFSEDKNAVPVRIVDDKNTPAYHLESPDTKYPYRQKELIDKVNEKLKGKVIINQYDILSIRRVYKINTSKQNLAALNIMKNLLIGLSDVLKKINPFLKKREKKII